MYVTERESIIVFLSNGNMNHDHASSTDNARKIKSNTNMRDQMCVLVYQSQRSAWWSLDQVLRFKYHWHIVNHRLMYKIFVMGYYLCCSLALYMQLNGFTIKAFLTKAAAIKENILTYNSIYLELLTWIYRQNYFRIRLVPYSNSDDKQWNF